MISGFSIDPDGLYDDMALYEGAELKPSTLARARREGRLKYTRRGDRILYFGSWVLDWLRADSVEETARA
jgi:hypothetical protein